MYKQINGMMRQIIHVEEIQVYGDTLSSRRWNITLSTNAYGEFIQLCGKGA